MDDAQRELYRDILVEHSQAPQNRGQPPHFDSCLTQRNPDTGDAVTVWVGFNDGACIDSIRWEAQGSSLLTASCSLMSELLARKPRDEALSLIHHFIAMLTTPEAPDPHTTLGDAAALAGIRHLPARVRCASLPWRTAEAALNVSPQNTC